jgi:hypothetical protein
MTRKGKVILKTVGGEVRGKFNSKMIDSQTNSLSIVCCFALQYLGTTSESLVMFKKYSKLL